MNDQILKQILGTLEEIKSTMATKEEIGEIKSTMATKSDIEVVQRAVLEISETVNRIEAGQERLLEDQKSIHEILGEHEVSIRTLRRKPV